MKTLIITVFLFLIGLIYILTARSQLYTLLSENDNYTDVISWVTSKNPEAPPIPVTRTEILVANKKITRGINSSLEKDPNNYIGTIKILGEKRNPDLQVEWYDLDGNPQGSFMDSWLFDYPFPTYRIESESGNLVSIDIFNKIRIISPQGEIIKEFEILSDYKYNIENVIYVDLKKNHLISAVCEVTPDANKKPTYQTSVIILDFQGNVIMKLDQPGWQLQALGTSDNGSRIAVSLFNWNRNENPDIQFNTIILANNGDIIQQIPYGFQQAIFNENNDRILLISKSHCYLYDIINKKQIGIYTTLEERNLFIAATFISPSKLVAIEEGTPGRGIEASLTPWKYDNIYIRTIDETGRELNPFFVENITLFNPSLQYNKDDQTIFIGHSTGWKLYKVEN